MGGPCRVMRLTCGLCPEGGEVPSLLIFASNFNFKTAVICKS